MTWGFLIWKSSAGIQVPRGLLKKACGWKAYHGKQRSGISGMEFGVLKCRCSPQGAAISSLQEDGLSSCWSGLARVLGPRVSAHGYHILGILFNILALGSCEQVPKSPFQGLPLGRRVESEF